MLECIAEIPPVGDYFSLAKVIVMLVLVTPWLLAAPWIFQDAKHVRAPEAVWGGAFLAAGVLGFLFWLLLPVYGLGLGLFLVLTSGCFISYVVFRNGRVEEGEKLTLTRLLSREKRQEVTVLTRVKLYTGEGKVVIAPDPAVADAEACQAYNITQNLLYDLAWRRASEADIAPTAQGQTRVRFVIDGVAVDQMPLSLNDSETIIQFVKSICGMEVEDRRRPQRGKIAVDIANSPIDIQIACAGTTTGQRMQFRVVQEVVQTKLDQLGMEESLLKRVRELTHSESGLFIVSAMPGNGMTSTLYSLLREQDAFIKQLVTLEKKINVDIENVTQHEYGEESKLAQALASAIRRDPNILMIDGCSDNKSASLICDASSDKFLMLGIHASDSITALAKWIKITGDPKAAVENLRGIVCQMLIRRLCPTCREPYKPDPSFLAKANLQASNIDNFYRPPSRPVVDEKGRPIICATCQGSGYFGRTSVFELLEMTDEVRQLVIASAPLAQIKSALRKNKMSYLQENALNKVIEGITSIQEVIRVSQQGKK